MRIALALVVATLLIAPGAVAEETEPVAPQHNECEDGPGHDECHNKESPGVGLLAAVGAIGALAFLVRRRNA